MNEADELARRVADTLRQREGAGAAWGVVIDEARAGYARIHMTLRDDMLNGHRIAHGGMIFALADTAFAYACNSRNENTVAQQASIAFLAPAKAGDTLAAEAREVSRSGRSGVYHVSVRGAGGEIIAEFTGLSRTIGGTVID
ncbi:hydroxyphenylacetyl-CoA thioesterase PaaI [Candidatus Viadribacter manganicus]|uniref:Phenylacetic acid degradation protein PaaD n=1 Tax=Candidatus Viadribacter manganicus TaxID=1759059 RepID=A0A1B1AGF3_9PROT|nr:hydroxyphenylacetyl-CoA thioesterase PaaI [Candidatus Viadribacter manganicus]ANP45621.1 phenylacetic acid degradation protein PaaD [Candidatus Viadribacter manganicus]